IVDETGRAIGEERTIVLSIMAVLDPHFRIRLPKPFASRRKGPVVVNLSTTRAVEDVAARYGVAVERTRIGEAHVVDRMKHAGSLIGGEGNGGVIFPAVHFGRDSATGIGLTLALLSGEGRKSHRKLSELNHSIRDYVILKDKVELKDRAEIARSLGALKRGLGGLRQLCPGENPIADETDGLKIILSDRWVHVRASGTEPIMRLFAEAPTEKDASALLNWAGRALKKG
ncbi:hypothetical protein HY256_06300, partial [Candidatus Sumerlaeota bacterium]|nr:hypothetical protein [Candidatus Sumerlaeota bacterium]